MTMPSRVSSERSGVREERPERQPQVIEERAHRVTRTGSASTGSSCSGPGGGPETEDEPDRGRKPHAEHDRRELHRGGQRSHHRHHHRATQADGPVPAIPPTAETTMDSITNCSTMVRLRAAQRPTHADLHGSARGTETSMMMFMMPMPPTSMVMNPMPTATP